MKPRENIDAEEDKCCHTCFNGYPVQDSELGYCIICRIDDDYKDITEICDKIRNLFTF